MVKIICIFYFACGMTLKCKLHILLVDAAAVVRYANIGLASIFDFHDDGGCPRIDGVFNKLLHDRQWPVDHFARCNLICHMLWQFYDFFIL
jgi:hypothetical protein